jgi:hypothetical protein
MFRTITARFPGTCRRCGQAIDVGERIRYGGRGRTYHLKADCAIAGEVAADRVFKATNGAAGRSLDDSVFNEPSDPRADFGYDGRQMGYCPTDDQGDW